MERAVVLQYSARSAGHSPASAGWGSAPCTADAFADASFVGPGGWWALPGKPVSKESVAWFSIKMKAGELPVWLRAPKMQQHIAALEALGQLLLPLPAARSEKTKRLSPQFAAVM